MRASAICAAIELHLLRAAAAVGADGVRAGRGQVGHRIGRADAHHRAQVGVEAHRDDDRQVGRDLLRGGQRRVGLAQVAQSLDQHQVDAALDQRRELLGEQRLGLLGGHGAERRQQLAGRAEVAGDQQPVLVGHRPGDPRGAPVDLGERGPRGRACPAAAGCRRRCWWSGSARRPRRRPRGPRGRASGFSRFQSSPGAPSSSPRSCSSVPMPPSSSTGRTGPSSAARRFTRPSPSR